MQRQAPALALCGHVAAYFSVTLDDDGGSPATVRTLPDGCSDLMFNLGPAPCAWVRGPRTRAACYEHHAPMTLVGVQLQPGALHALTGLAASRLRDRWQSLDDTMEEAEPGGAAAAQRLQRAMREAHELTACAALLDAYLEPRLQARAVDRRVLRALASLAATGGGVAIADLAAQCATSERNLGRLFARWVGLAPKRLALILRFQRVLSAANSGQPPAWGDLAHELGYSDQPHLIRDFAAYAGLSPAALLGSSGSA
ncbi:AraC family transcriptional regulator [Niveibacterium sp. SC-1]|uniref:AraC family transcriptional regulator n=1 Tax=Niveibacterium sp. SC-1 TaxID=3135646 RepID=UPI00311FB013